MLRDAGWSVSDGRVERLWRREGLKVPLKQPKKGRLWLNDGSCVRLRPEHRNHVWSYDFVHYRTDEGKVFRTLNIIDEHSRECLAIKMKRKSNSIDVIDALTDLFILRGRPVTFVQTMALSSLLRPFRIGLPLSVPRLPTSSQDHFGRTGIVKALMVASGMNSSTAKFSTRSEKHQSSLKNGGSTTTQRDRTVHWATALQRQRPSYRWTKGQSCTNFQIAPLKWGRSNVRMK